VISTGVDARPVGAELELVLLCARTRLAPGAEARLRELMTGPLDWGQVLSMAAGHHTLSLLYHHVTSMPLDGVPDEVLSDLRAHYLHLAARSLRLMHELEDLTVELEAAKAPPVVWKGPVLAYTVYPSPELRTFNDLDLLVRGRDVGIVRRILEARGFRAKHGPETSPDELFSRRSADVKLTNPETGAAVDLHWGSVPRYFSSAMDCERLWAQHEVRTIDGSEIRVLEPGTMLLALCLHGAKHYPYPWPALKWVSDIEAVVRALPAERWDSVLTRARGLGCHRMLLLGLLLAQDLLDAPLPSRVQAEISADSRVADLLGPVRHRMLSREIVPFSFAERFWFDLAVRERRRDRIVYRATRVLRPGGRDEAGAAGRFSMLRVPFRLLRLGRRHLRGPNRGRPVLLGRGSPVTGPDPQGRKGETER
jgi:hypothetical protein